MLLNCVLCSENTLVKTHTDTRTGKLKDRQEGGYRRPEEVKNGQQKQKSGGKLKNRPEIMPVIKYNIIGSMRLSKI